MNEKLELTIVTDLTEDQIDQLLELYQNEFWCNKRKRKDLASMLMHSDMIVGVEDRTHHLVGFARILTDYSYKAILFDLIVHPKWRGKAVGRFLMDTVISHPKLCKVEHFDLNCLPEMVPFYEKWGFTAELGTLKLMRRSGHQQ